MTFLLSYVPHSVVHLLVEITQLDSNSYFILTRVTALGLTINAALDPYLYSFQNPKLKRALKKMILCQSNEHAPPPQNAEH